MKVLICIFPDKLGNVVRIVHSLDLLLEPLYATFQLLALLFIDEIDVMDGHQAFSHMP